MAVDAYARNMVAASLGAVPNAQNFANQAAASASAANASEINAGNSATASATNAGIAATQAANAASSAAAALTSQQVAQAAANATGILYSATSVGASPPYKVTAIAIGAAGTATSNGRFNGTASGLSGFTWSYLATSGSGISAPVYNNALSTSGTAPTLGASAGGVSGATATATMSQLANGETFWALSSDGLSQLLWTVSGGVVAAVNGPTGAQVSEYLKSGVDAKTNTAITTANTVNTSVQNAFKGFYNYTGSASVVPFLGAIGPSGYRIAHGYRTSDGAMVHYGPITGPGVDTGVANSTTGKQIATTTRTQIAANSGRTVLLAANYSEMLSFDAGDVYLGGVPALRKAAAYDYLPAANRPALLGTAGYDSLMSYGQSLSEGDGTNMEVITTAPPAGFTNLFTFNGGVKATSGADVTSIAPLFEDNWNTDRTTQSTANGETILSGCAYEASRRAMIDWGVDVSHLNIFAFSGGRGSQNIANLSKGSTWYNRMITKVTAAATLAAAQGKPFRLHAYPYLQGEQNIDDGSTYTYYLGALLQLATDIDTDVRAAINTVMAANSLPQQTTPVHMLIYQTDYKSRTTAGANIILAQAEAVRQHPLIHFACPIWYAPNSDAYHKTGPGYKWIGYYFGRAWEQLVIEGRVPDALWAQTAYVQSATPQTVRIKFRVPKPPLQIDTVSIGKATDNGVLIKDDTGTLTLSNFRVENGDTLLIDINRTLGTNPIVRCGLDYIGTGITGGTTRASHNLRDSTTTTRQIVSAVVGTASYPLYHLANAFQLNIITLGA